MLKNGMSKMDASTHFESLIRMHDSVKINEFYKPTLSVSEGTAEIEINLTEKYHHAAGGVHGSVYFIMAVREGFEPSNGLTRYTLSRRAPSASQTPHQRKYS